VTAGALARHTTTALVRTGLHRSTTAKQPSFVSRYRYPETPRSMGVTTSLYGPERVFLVHVSRRIANFGVVITQRARRVEPRIVAGLDENRLTGYAGLPVNHNPYMTQFRDPVLAAGALSPAPGEYAIVFDSAGRDSAGSFTFRYWTNDVTPPSLRLRRGTVRRGTPVLVSASDAGAGVSPASIQATVDGQFVRTSFRNGVISIPTGGLSAGTHRVRLRVSDYQESKNTENVPRILPNTRTRTVVVRVR
jgi:hypothetical protein